MEQMYSALEDNLGVIVCKQESTDKFLSLYKDNGSVLIFTGNRKQVEDYLGTKLEYILVNEEDYE